MSTIVVGYDQTAGVAEGARAGGELAKALGSKLVVTSVTPLMMSAGRSAGPIDPDRPAREARQGARGRAHVP